MDHEVTGLAWDGKSLWFGVVLPLENRQEDIPKLGVVEQMNLLNQEVIRSYPVAGVGPGTSDWTPHQARARRFWWYDAITIAWRKSRPPSRRLCPALESSTEVDQQVARLLLEVGFMKQKNLVVGALTVSGIVLASWQLSLKVGQASPQDPMPVSRL
jgi:hypothetical protein